MKLELTEEKEKEITNFLIDRFKYFQDLRRELDNKIISEIEIYNDYDKSKDDLTGKEKETIPYVYTIVQTMVARLIDTFFSRKNYLKIYVENKKFKKIEKSLREWIQSELDVMKFSARARDFIEESLIQRTVWLEPRPVLKGKKLQCIDFNILEWFDVWFDTGAKTVNESDFFVRKIVPYYIIMQNEKIYFNLEKIAETSLPSNMKGKQEYKAKHGGIIYYDPEKNNVTDKVELLEYSGVYDIGEEKNKPKFENVLFVLANQELLIRAEKSDLDTKQKILLFPIRPLKQANSLIGKSVPQITRKMAETLNEIWQLLLRNFRIIVKLLFKYKKDAGIDLDELFADGGNAIGYEDNPNDISIFETKNIVQIALILLSQIIQMMQQLTGAVDYLMGTTAGRGITETAAGINKITEQAMFKFSMMALNIYNDLLDFITFCIILWSKYGKAEVLLEYPELEDFLDQLETKIEKGKAFDIGLNDLTLRRDVERTQFINASNVLATLIDKTGGDLKKFLAEIMDKLEIENAEEILYPKEQQVLLQQLAMVAKSNPQILQMLSQIGVGGAGGGLSPEAKQKQGGSPKAVPQAEKQSMPEEEVESIRTPNR